MALAEDLDGACLLMDPAGEAAERAMKPVTTQRVNCIVNTIDWTGLAALPKMLAVGMDDG